MTNYAAKAVFQELSEGGGFGGGIPTSRPLNARIMAENISKLQSEVESMKKEMRLLKKANVILIEELEKIKEEKSKRTYI
jgi:hypothetical protein